MFDPNDTSLWQKYTRNIVRMSAVVAETINLLPELAGIQNVLKHINITPKRIIKSRNNSFIVIKIKFKKLFISHSIESRIKWFR